MAKAYRARGRNKNPNGAEPHPSLWLKIRILVSTASRASELFERSLPYITTP